jgi:hypothetical protein
VAQQLAGGAGVSKPRSSFELIKVGGLEINDITWAIEGHIEVDSLNLLFGAPGCGKSFISIDMACCVATGTPWHGHKVKQGLVVYVAGEGHNGLARRFKAWEKKHGTSLKDAPLFKSVRAAQFYNLTSALEVAESVREIVAAEGVGPALIIIDTVARNMGGDENSTQDMNAFIENLDALLRHPYKAAILAVHHSGKASPGQARGSTALRGALDAEYQIEMDPTSKMITMSNCKMKDGEVPPDKTFSISQLGLGVFSQETGAEIIGAALETVDISGLVNQVRERATNLTKNQNLAMNALQCLVVMDSMKDITVDDWRDSCHERGLARNRFHEVKDALVAKLVVNISVTGIVKLVPGASENG